MTRKAKWNKMILAEWLARTPLAGPEAVRLLQRFVWLARYQEWMRAHPCPVFPERADVYAEVRGAFAGGGIDYLEFGVWQGRSLKWWLEHVPDADSTFHGFDTFTGLPETWEFAAQGQFSTGGKVPDIQDRRCRFHAGLFQDTLPAFLRDFRGGRRKVINLDADLFSSTLFVLVTLYPVLRPGDILIFDEWNSFENEFRAFWVFNETVSGKYRVLARDKGGFNLALQWL